MKKEKELNVNEIDISTIVRIFWKNKILVSVLTILFTLVGYFYSQTFDKSKEFTSHITVRLPSPELFFEFGGFYAGGYNEEFNSNLRSTEILIKFAQQKKNIENFKKHLEKNNVSLNKYLINKFDEYDPDLYKNRYRFRYHESLDGNDFLNDYVHYIKNITMNIIKNRIKGKINIELYATERSLEVANKINLKKSLIQDMSDNKNNIFFTYPPPEKYYKGTIILEEDIKRIKILLMKLKNEEFNYNPISTEAFIKATHSKNYNIYTYIGFISGILLSLIIIISRKVISEK